MVLSATAILLLASVASASNYTSNKTAQDWGSRPCISNLDNVRWCPPCNDAKNPSYCLEKYGVGQSCYPDIGANWNATIEGVAVTGGCSCWGFFGYAGETSCSDDFTSTAITGTVLFVLCSAWGLFESSRAGFILKVFVEAGRFDIKKANVQTAVVSFVCIVDMTTLNIGYALTFLRVGEKDMVFEFYLKSALFGIAAMAFAVGMVNISIMWIDFYQRTKSLSAKSSKSIRRFKAGIRVFLVFYGVAVLYGITTGWYFFATGVTTLVVVIIIVSYGIGGPKFAKLLEKGGSSDKVSTAKGPAFMARYMTKHIILSCLIFITAAMAFTMIRPVADSPNPFRSALIAFMNSAVCYATHVMSIYIMSGSKKLFSSSKAISAKMWAASTVTSSAARD